MGNKFSGINLCLIDLTNNYSSVRRITMRKKSKKMNHSILKVLKNSLRKRNKEIQRKKKQLKIKTINRRRRRKKRQMKVSNQNFNNLPPVF
jgi:hypothetical protein